MDMKHNGSTAQSDAAGAYASGGPLILIADASPSSRDTLSADLGRLAYRVSAVESGSAALMMLRSERPALRSEEHTSELQSLMRISYAVFCLKKKKKIDYLITAV